jgi:hypothetical protein
MQSIRSLAARAAIVVDAVASAAMVLAGLIGLALAKSGEELIPCLLLISIGAALCAAFFLSDWRSRKLLALPQGEPQSNPDIEAKRMRPRSP